MELEVQTAPLCQGTTSLTGQPRFLTGCVENRRWTFHKVTFATLNVQGSCNNLCSSGAGDAGGDIPEYTARLAADELWLQQTFAEAKAQGSAGVMIIWQADPGFDTAGFQGAPKRNSSTLVETDGNPDGFHDILSKLRDETISFRKPVVLVHGDSHYVMIDRPLLDAGGRRVENFTRVETFGDHTFSAHPEWDTNDVHWVKALVDPQSRDVFAFQPPLIVLLHGFPEFWFGWRRQIEPLAAAGFRVVAPDTRGINLSSKPEGFKEYGVDLLADDIWGLIGELGAGSALLVGHDWGGSIAWTVAMNHPEVVDRLAILNAAHPRRLSEGLHHPDQLRKSWYFFFFATPGLPEEVVHLRDWHFFRHFLHDANPPYTPEEMERYIEAWSQPGAAAGMINYYRASVRQSQKEAAAKLRPISAETLVIWGERDSYLGSDLAEPHADDVPNLDRVERLADASHWVHHDEAERVNQLLVDFFTAG